MRQPGPAGVADTTKSDRLIELARGADVLVHEAMWLPGIDRIVAREPNGTPCGSRCSTVTPWPTTVVAWPPRLASASVLVGQVERVERRPAILRQEVDAKAALG